MIDVGDNCLQRVPPVKTYHIRRVRTRMIVLLTRCTYTAIANGRNIVFQHGFDGRYKWRRHSFTTKREIGKSNVCAENCQLKLVSLPSSISNRLISKLQSPIRETGQVLCLLVKPIQYVGQHRATNRLSTKTDELDLYMQCTLITVPIGRSRSY